MPAESFGPAEQNLFARELRQRLPKPPGAEYHDTFAFSEYASKVLDRTVHHWRSLTRDEARTVIVALRREYPRKINPI